jgi:exodeoxyribonuclease V beta subunit
MPADSGEEVPAVETESMVLSCRNFTGAISHDWKIASFSGLTAKTGDRPVFPASATIDIPDHDRIAMQDEPVLDMDPLSIFAFPKGAGAGSLLHEIFEVLDFTNTDESGTIVAEKLQEHGFEKKWEQTITGMITRVMNAMLGTADGLTLSRVGMADRLSELEFHFPLQPTTPAMLSAVFAAHGINNCSTQFPEHIEKLAFSPVRGFMKGYIDLVFQFNGRFYLIDWKSNHLGNRVEDYTRERMAQEMEERFYLLQSNLYALALHQYLKKRLPGYRYRDHFGGVFYIFLRGVSYNPEDQFGIYRDLPGEALIEALSRELIGTLGK